MKKIFMVKLAAGLVATVALAEISARKFLGLGTPPLTVADRDVEYMFAPNQDVNRFGNRILINQFGMRSAALSYQKAPNETRILVFGDSVVNGGAQTDHQHLATTLLEQRRTSERGEPQVVGNVSAGSWGPGNWLAYARKFGLFNADAIVLVVSGHDYADNPTFAPLNPDTHPTERPLLALLEGATRYLPRYVPALGSLVATELPSPTASADDIERGLKDLREFLLLAKATCGKVLVIQHWERSELETTFPPPGIVSISKLCSDIGVDVYSMDCVFRAAQQAGNTPYRDNIHPNLEGQKLMAGVIYKALKEAGI